MFKRQFDTSSETVTCDSYPTRRDGDIAALRFLKTGDDTDLNAALYGVGSNEPFSSESTPATSETPEVTNTRRLRRIYRRAGAIIALAVVCTGVVHQFANASNERSEKTIVVQPGSLTTSIQREVEITAGCDTEKLIDEVRHDPRNSAAFDGGEPFAPAILDSAARLVVPEEC